jgi:hypothetical protein
MRKERLPELISEIKNELKLLDQLVSNIVDVRMSTPRSSQIKSIYEESLALKLHNYYTGCERIFQKVAEDINGGVTRSLDWHKRLLNIMSLDIENIRPPVISRTTAKELEDFLAFRHVVRNIYGFEIDPERLDGLINKVKRTQTAFKRDINKFLVFLRKMAG